MDHHHIGIIYIYTVPPVEASSHPHLLHQACCDFKVGTVIRSASPKPQKPLKEWWLRGDVIGIYGDLMQFKGEFHGICSDFIG